MKHLSALEVQAKLLANTGIYVLRVEDLDEGYLLSTNLTSEDLTKMAPKITIPGYEVYFIGVGQLEGSIILGREKS